MKKLLLLPLLFLLLSMKDKPAYQLFTGEGKNVDYRKMLKELEEADVVLFGELHNDPIAHWLQLELAKDLHKKHGQQLVLGAEMFEADAQLVLDEYISGKVAEKNFEAESRPWNNYKTDYKPLVQFAR
ncbi:MAG: ChaN family lipoprotein, partial [Hymenobacteraceae bacterium]|nr:ChaN family lipoprotein [Hymenobacteraceae bacterium]MDX5394723.1 ChaN family lipoprotein [Hymenobacteraceae bacterium]MDX5510756.1 ChaN family lipoprotein [Hymenobacteraceae bacterium]